MTKVLKMLSSIGLVAVLGVALLGVSVASAESPPAPPARFAGKVTIDGQKAPAGTIIEARVGTTSCGVTTTFDQGGEARYVLDVPALDPGATPNCGTEGAAVTFVVGGQAANETGSWLNYQLNLLDLTVTAATPTTTTATPTKTPGPPDTGEGFVDGSGNTGSSAAAIVLLAALGLGVAGFGVGGAVVARRSK